MSQEETPEKRRLEITVEEIEGDCPIYRPGDKIVIDKFWIAPNESNKICVHAFSSMATFLMPFSRGISAEKLGLGKQRDEAYIQCPDPGPPRTCGGTVLFKLRRI